MLVLYGFTLRYGTITIKGEQAHNMTVAPLLVFFANVNEGFNFEFVGVRCEFEGFFL